MTLPKCGGWSYRNCNSLYIIGVYLHDLTVAGDNQCGIEEARTFHESFLCKHDAFIYALLHLSYISITHGRRY